MLLRSPVLIGAICLVLAEAMFAGLGAMIKHLSSEMNQAQLVFFRNFFALIVLLPWVWKSGLGQLKTQRLPLHILRASTGLLSLYCFFLVLANMPLAQAMMALLIAPFIVPIVARVWLQEHISRKGLVAILLGFIGAGFVLSPKGGELSIYMLIALGCAILVAVSKCCIRLMSDTESPSRIVFYFTAMATGASFIPMLFEWQSIESHLWIQLIFMGALASAGQLLMTQAFRLASPITIGLLTYTNVIFASLLGYWFWNEDISSGLVAGAILVVLAANLSIRQRWLF